ncbi:MAG: hypothetical protein NC935_02970 [Candidatus Omnitrophica bacterium]|nr:hypothetical protein [Candidatus Omnitrophota bacterium]
MGAQTDRTHGFRALEINLLNFITKNICYNKKVYKTAFLFKWGKNEFKIFNMYLGKKLILITISFAFLFFLFLATKKILIELRQSINNFHLLINTTTEDRKNIYYGYCNNFGYGYVKEIVSKIPEKGIIPEIRYKDYQKFIDLFLPLSRYKKDDRLKIGINLSDNDIKESKITEAFLIGKHNMDGKEETVWKFNTENDYDIMTGIKLSLEKNDNIKPLIVKFKITLYPSIYETTPLNHWVIENIPFSSILIYRFPKPIINFSYNRGCVDFILKIEYPSGNKKDIKINSVEILGVKVDIKDYKIINRKEKCFTAIKKTFYKKILEEKISPWILFLKEINNVRDN